MLFSTSTQHCSGHFALSQPKTAKFFLLLFMFPAKYSTVSPVATLRAPIDTTASDVFVKNTAQGWPSMVSRTPPVLPAKGVGL